MSLLCQVSSVELERVVIASVPAVMEAAAVGVTPPGGGPQQLVMFLVLHTRNTGPVDAQAPCKREIQRDGAAESHTSFQDTQAQAGSAGQDQQQGKAANGPEAGASSSHARDTGQDDQANDVGIGPSLEGLWGGIVKVKAAAVTTASRVADLAVVALQKTSIDSAEQQAAYSQAGSDGSDVQPLKLQCQQAIGNSLNPLFKLERVLVRDSLPRTASNKVMRRVLRDELRLSSAKL